MGDTSPCKADTETCPSRREALRISLGVRIFSSDGVGEVTGVISVWTSDESEGTEKRRDPVDSKPDEVAEWPSLISEPSSDEVDMMIGVENVDKGAKADLVPLCMGLCPVQIETWDHTHAVS